MRFGRRAMQAEGAEVHGQDVSGSEPGRSTNRSMRGILGDGAARFGLLIAWGCLIVGLGIESLIVTLGMGTLLAGLTYAVTAQPIFGLSNTLIEAASHPIHGFQLTVLYAIALTAILWYIDRFTAIGQFVFFTGAGRL